MTHPLPPTVSVIVPTYNRKETLCRCLAALAAQTYPDPELIVVDDGSSDETQDTVRRSYPSVRYLRAQRNLGAAAARNRGLEVATGEIIFFTDDDCVPPRDWLDRHLAYYRDREVGAVGGVQAAEAPNVYERFDRACYAGTQQQARRIEKGGSWLDLYTNNLSVRREALHRAGVFDERFPRGEDPDLSRRIAGAGYALIWDPALRVEHLKVHSLSSYLALWFFRGCGSMATDLKAGTLCPRRFVPLPNVWRLIGVWHDYRDLFGGGFGTSVGFWSLGVLARWCEVAGRVHFYRTSRRAFQREAQ